MPPHHSPFEPLHSTVFRTQSLWIDLERACCITMSPSIRCQTPHTRVARGEGGVSQLPSAGAIRGYHHGIERRCFATTGRVLPSYLLLAATTVSTGVDAEIDHVLHIRRSRVELRRNETAQIYQSAAAVTDTKQNGHTAMSRMSYIATLADDLLRRGAYLAPHAQQRSVSSFCTGRTIVCLIGNFTSELTRLFCRY